jgi:hypothetical protein
MPDEDYGTGGDFFDTEWMSDWFEEQGGNQGGPMTGAPTQQGGQGGWQDWFEEQGGPMTGAPPQQGGNMGPGGDYWGDWWPGMDDWGFGQGGNDWGIFDWFHNQGGNMGQSGQGGWPWDDYGNWFDQPDPGKTGGRIPGGAGKATVGPNLRVGSGILNNIMDNWNSPDYR